MAFGDTGILDNFDRANDATPPPGSNWASLYNGHVITSNQLVGYVSGDANVSYWVGATYGPSIEAFIGVKQAASHAELYVIDPTIDHGYAVSIDSSGSGTFQILRIDEAGVTEVQLGATIVADVDNNQSFGIYYDAATDTIYAYVNTGSWASVGNRTDSTYTDMNTLMFFNYTAEVYDDFGGGTVTGAGGSTADTQSIYLKAESTTTDTQAIFLQGYSTLVDNQSIFLQGIDSIINSQPVYLNGADSILDTQAIYLKGENSLADNLPIYINATTASVLDSQSIYLSGATFFPFTDTFTGSNDDPWDVGKWKTEVA